MNRLLTILLLLGATAHGQINNPPTSVNIVDSTATGRAVLTATNAAAAATAIGLGTANEVTFNRVQVGGASFSADDFSGGNFVVTGGHALTFSSGGTSGATLTNLGLGAANNVTFSNITANGIVTANDSTATPATSAAAAQGIQWPGLGGSQHWQTVSAMRLLGGTSDLATRPKRQQPAPSQTATVGSLMTRDFRMFGIGEMWNAADGGFNTTESFRNCWFSTDGAPTPTAKLKVHSWRNLYLLKNTQGKRSDC
jgi:hypothetical protein